MIWAEQWREVNRALWDEGVPIHVAGEFCDVPGMPEACPALPLMYSILATPR